jgi:uncharacterized protein (UPF0335 family)
MEECEFCERPFTDLRRHIGFCRIKPHVERFNECKQENRDLRRQIKDLRDELKASEELNATLVSRVEAAESEVKRLQSNISAISGTTHALQISHEYYNRHFYQDLRIGSERFIAQRRQFVRESFPIGTIPTKIDVAKILYSDILNEISKTPKYGRFIHELKNTPDDYHVKAVMDYICTMICDILEIPHEERYMLFNDKKRRLT